MKRTALISDHLHLNKMITSHCSINACAGLAHPRSFQHEILCLSFVLTFLRTMTYTFLPPTDAYLDNRERDGIQLLACPLKFKDRMCSMG